MEEKPTESWVRREGKGKQEETERGLKWQVGDLEVGGWSKGGDDVGRHSCSPADTNQRPPPTPIIHLRFWSPSLDYEFFDMQGYLAID